MQSDRIPGAFPLDVILIERPSRYRAPMMASGWHGGGDPHSPAGYGIKFTADDRDRYFERSWDSVVVDLDGAGPTAINLSDSFWRRCSEVRSADVGRWLLASGAAPWPKQNPAKIVVTPVDGNRFAARIHIPKGLPGV